MICLAFVLAAGSVVAAPAMYSVDAAHSSLTYHIVHKLHEVSGTSHDLETKARLLPDGTLQVMARAAIVSFKSGDGNRDEHMVEAVEGNKYPYVIFKGTAKVKMPDHFPAKEDVATVGEITFHGQTHKEKLPIQIAFTSPEQAKVTADFKISLDAYKVERPSLFFVKIDDACQIKADLAMVASAQ